MRFKNKYKFINSESHFLSKFSSRITLFKRPKWKRIQLLLSKFKDKKRFFLTKNLVPINFKKWEKLKFCYLENIKLKRSLLTFYGEKTLEFYKAKQKLFSIVFCNLFIKPFFKLTFFLKLINYTKSLEESNQKIIQKKIFINKNVVKNINILLKKGDYIYLKELELISPINSFSLNIINIFAEVDYYSSSILITKDYNLNDVEISLLINEKLSFYKINNYLYKK